MSIIETSNEQGVRRDTGANDKVSTHALNSHQEKMQRLDKLASIMDTQWRLPLLNVRIGWDTILGLVPGIGDTISSLISAYILKEGHSLGVPFWVKAIMLWNIFVDWLIGLVPLVGDLLDIGWKANSRNVKLIQKHARL